jgi:2-keto-4-pentenoate hydratase/2-oxohepta-3-ene-1,7-dioic acid hydratase in catechol pathway
VELGVVLAKGGKNINKEDWKQYVAAYFIAIDYTNK